VTANLRWQLLAMLLVIGALLYLLAPMLTPFAVAATLAYLFDPLADRMETWRLSRNTAVILIFAALTLVFVLVLLLLVPFLQRQVVSFITQLPVWLDALQTNVAPWAEKNLGISLERFDTAAIASTLQEHWKEAGGAAAGILAQISKSGFALIALVAHLIVIPVVFFYLLRDWDILVARINELIPRSVRSTIDRLAHESDEVLGAFLRGQISVMLVLGVLYSIGLMMVGISIGPLIGIIAGLISFVPYLGAIIGVAMGVIAAVIQYGDWLHVILVLVVFAVGHLIEAYVLVPKMIGDKIGLHPVAVIFAILAGGELFGFLGILLALPVASVAMVLLRYAHERYRDSALYNTERGAQVAADMALTGEGPPMSAAEMASMPVADPPPKN
jgi:predicted PurR-regulated permease PerM